MTEVSWGPNRMGQTIWICRHGNRIDFVDPSWRRRNGHDPHLSEDGVRQALETGARLRGEGIERIFCSPFMRTVETAHHIAEVLDLPVLIEHGAIEWLNPRWFARLPAIASAEELRQCFPRVDPSYVSLVTPRYPETAEDAFVRAGRTARLLAERYRENLLLVGHGHSVKGMSWGLLDARPTIHAGLCALVKVSRYHDTWRLELDGDASHLSGGEQASRRFQ